MLLKPNTFKKYQLADDTQLASRLISSIPRCSITLNRSVSGNGTLVVTKPENVQLIQPPISSIGSTLVTLPFSMSDIAVGSVIGFDA